MNDKIITFTKEQVIIIHDYLVKELGGSYGIRDDNLLKSVLENPNQCVFGEELYPTVFDKAAKLLLDFSRYQVFVDGNKRIGMSMCANILRANNYRLTLSNKEYYNIAMDIANNKITEVNNLSKILEQNCISLLEAKDIVNTTKQENDYEER